MNSTAAIVPRLDLMRVADVMHTGLVVCDPSAPLTEIARILAEARIHCVVVHGIERTRDGERLTWGIVSDRDLVRALDTTDAGVTAGALAVTALLTVEPDETLDQAIRLMASHDVTHIVVVEHAFPVGIVSTIDVARAASGIR
jgi:CBS domain-containing protein